MCQQPALKSFNALAPCTAASLGRRRRGRPAARLAATAGRRLAEELGQKRLRAGSEGGERAAGAPRWPRGPRGEASVRPPAKVELLRRGVRKAQRLRPRRRHRGLGAPREGQEGAVGLRARLQRVGDAGLCSRGPGLPGHKWAPGAARATAGGLAPQLSLQRAITGRQEAPGEGAPARGWRPVNWRHSQRILHRCRSRHGANPHQVVKA
mmetsp:Transcript_83286/g.236009  ORF Transcript_83286/g.236009 Transcript_83286/m.236009 type:complete len:209 (-) Transcript_83286:18-644(-)